MTIFYLLLCVGGLWACVYMGVHGVGVWTYLGQDQSLCLLLLLSYFSRSLTEPRFSSSARDHLVCPKPWDSKCTPADPASYTGAEDPHPGPAQALYQLTHLSGIYVLLFRTLTVLLPISFCFILEYFTSLQLRSIYSSQQNIFSFSISILVG